MLGGVYGSRWGHLGQTSLGPMRVFPKANTEWLDVAINLE